MDGRFDRRLSLRDGDPHFVNPFGFGWGMDDMMDRMLKDMGMMDLGPILLERRRPEAYIRGPTFMPLDLAETENEYSIKMEMPGLTKDKVQISLEDQTLVISAKEDEQKEERSENYLVRERRAFDCRRSIKLPTEVVESAIKAKMEDGILHLTLPKKVQEEKERSRTIDIE
jgi:HSP20 family molecular chaperone IbpA